MLILTRRVWESVVIADSMAVRILGVSGNQVRLGVFAPEDIPIHREEIYRRIKAEDLENRGINIKELNRCYPILNILS